MPLVDDIGSVYILNLCTQCILAGEDKAGPTEVGTPASQECDMKQSWKKTCDSLAAALLTHTVTPGRKDIHTQNSRNAWLPRGAVLVLECWIFERRRCTTGFATLSTLTLHR